MAALLIAQALGEGLHQLVEAAERLDLGALFGGEMLLGELAQPIDGQVEPVDDRLDGQELQTAKGSGEDAVEAVDVALVLDQGGAGEMVEALGVVAGEAGVEGFEEA